MSTEVTIKPHSRLSLHPLQSSKGENLGHYLVTTLQFYPPKALAVMLDSSLDFALQDSEGYTPLMHAVDMGCMPGIAAQLKLSALPGRNVPLGFGSTTVDRHRNVLHLIAFGRDIKASTRLQCSAVLERLLAHPDMDEETANAADLFGQTPLHVSFHSQASGDCAPALLRSPKILRGDADNSGDTPLHRLLLSARYFQMLGLQDHQFTPAYVKKLMWKLLGWKVNKAPVIDVFAANDSGLTAMDIACQLGDSFEDIQCTLECVMHGRKRRE